MTELELSFLQAALRLPCPSCKVFGGVSCVVTRGERRGEVAPTHGRRLTAAVAKGLHQEPRNEAAR